jgi:hypothetical protein
LIEQNYLRVDEEYYKQTDGLVMVMGAPTSSILVETYVYIQHMEHKQIYPVLIAQQMIAYFRCVDDSWYEAKTRQTQNTHSEFIKQPSIKFTIEKELYESIDFLDLTIHHKDRNLQFAMYRKPTQTDNN